MVYLKIRKDRLEELLKAEEKLRLLESYGVDNWDAYEYAMVEKTEDTSEIQNMEEVE